jgi:hypothetical protein
MNETLERLDTGMWIVCYEQQINGMSWQMGGNTFEEEPTERERVSDRAFAQSVFKLMASGSPAGGHPETSNESRL